MRLLRERLDAITHSHMAKRMLSCELNVGVARWSFRTTQETEQSDPTRNHSL